MGQEGGGYALRPGRGVTPSRLSALPPIRLDPLRPFRGAVASVYVHAPFCARRCFYCDFAVQVRGRGGSGEWLEALAGELKALEREARFRLREPLATLYVGGGTPSLLGPDAMEGLARLLGPSRVGDPGIEWTAEANPESFTPELAGAWRRAGVNRISLGVQTFSEEALRWMGRLHGAPGAEEAVATARNMGFDSVSFDLIFGLPGGLSRSWEEDLIRAVDLGVPHVSLYGLTVEPDTPLGRAVREGREGAVDEDRYREEYLQAVEILVGAGFEHYEVSNFARPGHASRHNHAYWGGGAYLGLGNSAHSYAHPLRRWNLRGWGEYQSMALRATLPVAGQEILGPGEHRLERVWLGLRTSRGMAIGGLTEPAFECVRSWERRGLARIADGAVKLRAAGWLLLDRLTVELDGALPTREPGTPSLDAARAPRRCSTGTEGAPHIRES